MDDTPQKLIYSVTVECESSSDFAEALSAAVAYAKMFPGVLAGLAMDDSMGVCDGCVINRHE